MCVTDFCYDGIDAGGTHKEAHHSVKTDKDSLDHHNTGRLCHFS